MARRKAAPERSALIRSSTTAPSRKQRPPTSDDAQGKEGKEADPSTGPGDQDAVPEPLKASAETAPIVAGAPLARPLADELPEIEPPEPKAEPWPDATPVPMKPVPPGEAVVRQRCETVGMPVVADVGRPPEMPRTTAPPPLVLGSVEDPTHMPGPREIPSGNPDDPASPPGHVPPGDSRSLRRDDQFALVYRVGSCIITRSGKVGTRGQWRVVEYPTSSSASNSYAKECSRFVSEGFSDYRE